MERKSEMLSGARHVLKVIERWYEWTAVKVFGYTGAVHFEEVILVLTGAFIGGVIASMFVANFMRKIYQIEDFGNKQISMTRITVRGKNWYTVKFTSFLEAFQQVILLAFSPPFTIGRFTKRDRKRTIIFVTVVAIVMVICMFFAILAIVSVFSPDDVQETVKLVNGIM